MMHCHPCDEDIPLDRIDNHVRLFHPDAWPVEAVEDATEHACAQPMREVTYVLPSHSRTGQGNTTQFTEHVVLGNEGDLWRCECRTLWRIGQACDTCDHYGIRSGYCPRGWFHTPNLVWRPARWWQRLLHIMG